jgi:hypothetical protein
VIHWYQGVIAKLLTRDEARRIATNLLNYPTSFVRSRVTRNPRSRNKGLASFAVELGWTRGDLGPTEG